MFRKKIKPQYFVILDFNLLKTEVCELEQNNQKANYKKSVFVGLGQAQPDAQSILRV
jgi:hypothetical protein